LKIDVAEASLVLKMNVMLILIVGTMRVEISSDLEFKPSKEGDGFES
jgi:hypothetical protein